METTITWQTQQGISYELRTRLYADIGEIQFDISRTDVAADGEQGLWSVANLTREAAFELRERLTRFLETGS